jgi:single-stranded-DNA-specific exonuclease
MTLSPGAVAPAWVLHPAHAPESADALARALGAPRAIGHVLWNRGVLEVAAARRFLEPSLGDLHDPGDLLDVDRAIERIERALEARERILVQGDYDVDGITSTFLMATALRQLGGDVVTRIPHRTRDGYGLTEAAAAEAHRQGARLIVTVDCGITAVAPIAHARTLGIDVLVTDHHEPGPRLPDAYAIVNPRRPGCRYSFKSLAGVGVTYKVVEALLAARGLRERAAEFLDVVALGTIADMVPLVGENRVLARHGLEQLQHSRRPGLQALIEGVGLAGRPVTDSHVGFVLAPRMNAAGRMGSAEQALRLLFARDLGEGRACAESLEEENTRRRELDERAAHNAGERVLAELGWPRCSSIMLWSESWHPGVLGIVASRMVDRFQRPTLLASVTHGVGRGSGRSAGGLHLTRVLEDCSDLLDSWGGHAFAAGFTARAERLPELRERFERLVGERLDPDACVPRLALDADLELGECDADLTGWMGRIAPHGLENPEPVFRARNVTVESWQRVGDGRHVRATVRDRTGRADVIGFGIAGQVEAALRQRHCDIAFVPMRNEWMGQTRVQLRLRGVRPA